MVFVVTLAGIDMNKVVLDGALDAAWHVVIHGGESEGHADGLVIAEPRTTFALHLRISKVDALHEHSVLWRISTEDTMKTVLTKWTYGTVANRISISLLFEDLLSGLWGNIFLLHNYLLVRKDGASRTQSKIFELLRRSPFSLSFFDSKSTKFVRDKQIIFEKKYIRLYISALYLYILVCQRFI